MWLFAVESRRVNEVGGRLPRVDLQIGISRIAEKKTGDGERAANDDESQLFKVKKRPSSVTSVNIHRWRHDIADQLYATTERMWQL